MPTCKYCGKLPEGNCKDYGKDMTPEKCGKCPLLVQEYDYGEDQHMCHGEPMQQDGIHF